MVGRASSLDKALKKLDRTANRVSLSIILAAVIMASFVYHAAMRDQPLPRKPVAQDVPCTETPELEE